MGALNKKITRAYDRFFGLPPALLLVLLWLTGAVFLGLLALMVYLAAWFLASPIALGASAILVQGRPQDGRACCGHYARSSVNPPGHETRSSHLVPR